MKTDNQHVSVLFMLFGILFCVCLITANVLETKQISLDRRTARISGFLYHQRLRVRGVGLWPCTHADMDGICHELPLCALRSCGRCHPRCSVLGWRRGISCRIRPGTAHCRSLVCGFSRLIVHQCLCNEPYEGVVGRP